MIVKKLRHYENKLMYADLKPCYGPFGFDSTVLLTNEKNEIGQNYFKPLCKNILSTYYKRLFMEVLETLFYGTNF